MKSESEVPQSCPTLCNPVHCNIPGSSVCGILQARVLEWVAISFFRALPDPGVKPRSPELSVQLLSRVRLFATPSIAALQASLSITISLSSLRLTSIESVMPSSHLILCRPLLLLPSIFPGIRVFSNKSVLHRSGQSIGISASVQFSFSLVTQSCPTLCDPMNCSTPGLPVHHHLPEFTQTHIHT